MNTYPHLIGPHEPTKKQLWLASFTSLLSRLPPEEAVKEADRAIQLCDERWREPEWVTSWNYAHNYPVGHQFGPRQPDQDSRPNESRPSTLKNDQLG
jgi:hypothetical protein